MKYWQDVKVEEKQHHRDLKRDREGELVLRRKRAF